MLAEADKLAVVNVPIVGIEPVMFPLVSRVKKLVDPGNDGRIKLKSAAIALGGVKVNPLELAVLFLRIVLRPSMLAAVLVADWNTNVLEANEADAVPLGRPVIVPEAPAIDPDWVIRI